ncbi:hypothetical protein ACFL5Q_05200, partial [Planctomycetota bacterium]
RPPSTRQENPAMKQRPPPVRWFCSFSLFGWLTVVAAAQAFAAEDIPAGSSNQPRPRATVEFLAGEHGSLNPCCQFRRSEAFRNRCDYVEDFVASDSVISRSSICEVSWRPKWG